MKKCQDLRLLTTGRCEAFGVLEQKDLSSMSAVDVQPQVTTVDERFVANCHGLLPACFLYEHTGHPP